MKRFLVIAAAASLLAGCASNRAHRAETARSDRDVQVVQPSDLSPEQIRIVQRALASRGQDVDIHGRFDQKTLTGLKKFQKKNNLPATGNLSFATVERLGINPADVMPVRGERMYDSTSPTMSAPDDNLSNPENSRPIGTTPSGQEEDPNNERINTDSPENTVPR
jgi:peptidoglycan hydrolase-like protein with peptidoglycan-binding domain